METAASFLDLPPELLQRTFSYLDARALCRVARVCTVFRDNANADVLWRELCRRRWLDKHYMVHEVFWRANLSHPAAVSKLTVGELKAVLRKRHIQVEGVLREKSDLIASVCRPHIDAQFGIPLPSKWKASFAAAELDARRCEITMEELTTHAWRITLKHFPPGMYQAAKFTKDFRYLSDEYNFSWKFWGSEHVQIAQFPPLRATRLPDAWGWRLTNDYATMILAPELDGVQIHFPDPMTVP